MSEKNEKAQDAKLTPVDRKFLDVFSIMQRRRDRFEDLLPPWMPTDRFVAGAKMAVSLQPDLLECTPESLLLALYKAARAGIDVSGGFLGHGALVKYGSEATFQPMYRGLVALAVVTGVVQDMTPVLVYEHDHFVPHEGSRGEIEHVPFVPRKKTDKRGDIIAAYTRVTLPSGQKVVKGLLYLDDIDRIESSVKAGKSPWKGPHRPEMVKKSSVKNAAKTIGLPSSDQARYFQAALQADTEAEGFEIEGEVVSTSAAPARGMGRLKALSQGAQREAIEAGPTPESVPATTREPGED